jgi:Na+-driven multidrug efflux pump
MGLITTILAVSLATPLSKVFVGYDDELYILTRHAFVLYSLSFLVVGHNIYSSAFFTALNNGSVSAGLSFIRIFAFECGAVMLLPLVWGVDGIWLSIVVAQVLALFVEIIVFVCYRKKYGYA